LTIALDLIEVDNPDEFKKNQELFNLHKELNLTLNKNAFKNSNPT
jgi:hypothetical protein